MCYPWGFQNSLKTYLNIKIGFLGTVCLANCEKFRRISKRMLEKILKSLEINM